MLYDFVKDLRRRRRYRGIGKRLKDRLKKGQGCGLCRVLVCRIPCSVDIPVFASIYIEQSRSLQFIQYNQLSKGMNCCCFFRYEASLCIYYSVP